MVPPDRGADLFDLHFAEIHRYIARRLPGDVADDLAAEVFVTALGGGHDPSLGEARPWPLRRPGLRGTCRSP
ncbi:hypothetical protein [Nonomuraea sp. NPDC052265]|uniref:hypothetical protein n=1 Tax=Nonomuraea sp. NPDC052265 TaxID=3364374 RepID=UPI0037CAB39C